MPAQLLSLTDGPSIMLDKPILLLGRHAECDIQLNSRKVSRRHCCLAQVHDYLVVRDLGSTNGVRINGKRVVEGNVRPGDELTIGNFRYQFFLDTMPRSGSNPLSRSEESLLEEAEVPIPLDDRLVKGPVLAAKPAPPAVKPKPATTATADDDSDSGIVLPAILRTGAHLRISSEDQR